MIGVRRGQRASRNPAALTSLPAAVLLSGILVLAVVVRWVDIGSRLSLDEAYSWFVAASPSAHVFLDRLAASENTPPLFYLLLQLGPSAAPGWLRVPAAVPGVLMCAVIYFVLRPRLGDRVSLLAALAVGVAPFLITYSNLARGFMLADLALLVAVWALVSLGERETAAKWGTFLVAGVLAVYTEYASAIFLIALALSALWIGAPRRRRVAAAGGLILLSLAPWVPEFVRGEHQVGVTKFNPMSATPSLSGLRDAAVTLAMGENGGTSSSWGRWCLFALMLAIAAAAAIAVRRGWAAWDVRARRVIQLLASTAGLTLAGYALAGAVGIDVFTQRYLTVLIPLGVALGAAALVSASKRPLTVGVSLLLIGLGLAGIVRRHNAEFQPDVTPVRSAALSLQPRTVLTNTPIVVYYLRSLRPQFDRPYNLGPGRTRTCARPCLIIDDTRVPGGTPRQAAGTQTAIGPFLLTLER